MGRCGYSWYMKRKAEPAAEAADKNEQADKPRPKIEMKPHKDFVFLCESRDGSNQILTNTLSLSQQVVPVENGPWDLVFSDDGFGALASSTTDDYVLLEDILDRHVYESGIGMLYFTEVLDREAKVILAAPS